MKIILNINEQIIDEKIKRMVLTMVWVFILLTAVSYCFVMKYVLSHVPKTVKVVKQHEKVEEFSAIHSVR